MEVDGSGWQRVAAASRSPMAVLSPDGGVVWANLAFADLLGRPVAGVIGAAHDALVAPDDRARAAAGMARILRDRAGGERLRVRYAVGDGAVDVSWDLGVDAETGLLYASGRVAEDEQAQLHERNEALLAALPELVFRMTRDGTYLDVRAEHPDLLAAPPAALIGRTVVDVFGPGPFAEDVLAAVTLAIDTGEIQDLQYSLDLPDGTGHFEARIARSGPDEVVAVVRDVTARVEATRELARTNERLARQNEELERFASVASHDLQEPLRKVTSFVRLLESRYTDVLDDRGKQYMHFVVDATERMRELVRGILELARTGEVSEPSRAVALADILSGVRASLSAAFEVSGATLEHPELPVVFAPPRALARVLENLVSNAIKYVGEGVTPQVRVTATRRDGAWVVGVADNGIGIDPEDHERVFQMFDRLHSRARYPGTGIGLALCRKIVRGWGGRMGVESDGTTGTRVWFTVPTAP